MARILIVDDENNIRRLLTGVLRDEGFATLEADTAEQAIELLHTRPDDIDLVLLDVALPGMDGVAALERIAVLPRPPSVVMMSGHGTVEIAVQCTKKGAFDFLEKPLNADRLLIVLRNALGARRLEAERSELLARLGGRQQLLGESEPMLRLRHEIQRAGASHARILIQGENGTGKELAARDIHDRSPRAGGPFVRLNCAAIPRDLIESELFGHERGAFTGAVGQKRGKFELANGGTLLLDEIGDMSLETQSKLLRVLEESEMERVGGTETLPLDVRVIAASNKNLSLEIARGAFREDLYFRIAVITITMPPLRQRGPDILRLAEFFLGRYCDDNGRAAKSLSPAAASLLAQYAWPGNVRELRNVMERVVIMLDENEVGAEALRPFLIAALADGGGPAPSATLRDSLECYERDLIERALGAAHGNIAQAARGLGLDRANLHRKLRRHGLLHRDRPSSPPHSL